ncbi:MULTISPECIES: protein-L-isoaspartate(D-aspartate) O-methyltransferase [Sphingomonas]|jgi:protein-L-isoaspartate(D-aspartate) O-methyltransferase|uniref:Protein-L-isoaspartate O-methyltransferase n=3 Tax=Bacteria TaxID=2 RepID=A0A7Y7QYK1_9SPHN|nr:MULTISPECIES: protein-L-isoaspartate(D-aspartate) O-methyltransferase [Sphingomonas]OAN65052.1 protein-L-isoaspartate O-methyltransferase [Sphingomonas sp. TDK1]AXJ97379.1 protein-L-isoaspartate(D-aspartate) O-methyltransferase [Sphingomonas sp. FARSPH]MBI0533487.1 protein-L-isoaspartate(D-aspartate) O-methyltransferase [Sphingomonas sp. TX0522]MBZ6383532.1 protein-L-isoaspartate(D-aspartate) O-methyltransferase [Sphingomonas sanguinis]MCI4653830.1 protein-L-isoaspartate(D-aspartate) O-meth
MIAFLLAAALAQAPTLQQRLALPLPEQRRLMVERIRTDVRKSAPSAATPALDRALEIIGKLPREDFVAPEGRRFAYVDTPQQIGYEQTISDPYVVAIMTAALDLPPAANVLDVGTGSGYQAAVLSSLAAKVWSIEIVDPLAKAAAKRLKRMGYRNVAVRSGDGFAGWPESAPFDGIIVAAGSATVPQPLIDQLKPGGRLVMPIGKSQVFEQLLVITKQLDGSLSRCSLGWAMFVPLTGKGQTPDDPRALFDRSVPLCHGNPIT